MRLVFGARDPRLRLVDHLRREGIADERVLAAMLRVPRERFVPPAHRAHAYRNIPLPIGEGQTISQPFVVALMTQALDLRGDEKVLEVGTGSGYQTAILAELARQVVSIERIARLAEQARQVLAALGYQNVRVLQGNGTLGWPPEAPYDAIIVTAAAPSVPPELLEQLAVDGRLVVPVGSRQTQELVLLRRESGGVRSSVLGPVRFVPLLGEGGWGPDDAPAAGP